MRQEIIRQLCNDEVVSFIANRHKIKTETLLKEFLAGEQNSSLTLLENEWEILRGLKKESEKK